MTVDFIANHLWQSSCFALLAAVLAFMLRANSPKVRYWVWLSASLKFLVPWALLVSLGSMVPWPVDPPASVADSSVTDALVQLAEPFSASPYAPLPMQTQSDWPVMVWAIGFIAVVLIRLSHWRRVQAMLRAGVPAGLPLLVPTLIAPGAHEPGVVGFLRPVIVFPELLLERLNPNQLEALLAHELCHIRRRDNLFAALHMGVEAIFWFHPMAWWIGSRMLKERELACDEEVLRLGHKPTDYIRGILTVCEHYSEAPLPCVSGVTGADVKRRLRTILQGALPRELDRNKKLALAFSALAAIAIPVGLGVWNAPAALGAEAQTFEVTSVKPYVRRAAGFQGVLPACKGGRFAAIAPTLITLQWAYNLQTTQQMEEMRAKLPQWAQGINGAYELEAITRPDVTEAECRTMTQKLFEDRFRFKSHWDTVIGDVFEMVPARGGFKMQPADSNDTAANISVTVNGRPTQFLPESPLWQGITMDLLAQMLSNNPRRLPVVNKTGIQGQYKYKLAYSAGAQANRDFADPDLFTAVEQQLGLKLQEARGPIAHFVVDSIEKPDTN